MFSMHMYPLRRTAVTTDDVQLCMKIWPALTGTVPTGTGQYNQLVTLAKERMKNLCGLFPQEDEIKVVGIIDHIRVTSDQPKEDVAQRFANELDLSDVSVRDREQLSKALGIGASLFLMMNIDSGMGTAISWEPDTSLKTLVSSYFERQPDQPSVDSNKTIDKSLTVSNLVTNYYGIVVDWTDHLDEHLEFDKENKVLTIYQHKLWLAAHILPSNECPVLPEVIGECLDTLNLLFPHHDPDTRSFLKQRRQAFNHLGSCSRTEKRSLKDYPRWGRNLMELADVLGGPQQGLLRQLLPRPDRRNLFDSINLFIALPLAVLAIAGCVIGAMSVDCAEKANDIAKESLELTRLQYLLSLAQACSDPDSSESVLQFCQKT
ncbi:hypothetical protein FALBO_3743 [Fusarium albosuccineum]|uniref:Uncharacterized protein n=1 Tax=Fusarium albosuccineum TaxID=1237068 RepID=A0A8H4LHU8_9HYPO|nr:hypothetical protein FALBO_3743 [Fusarium albosuccineum]